MIMTLAECFCTYYYRTWPINIETEEITNYLFKLRGIDGAYSDFKNLIKNDYGTIEKYCEAYQEAHKKILDSISFQNFFEKQKHIRFDYSLEVTNEFPVAFNGQKYVKFDLSEAIYQCYQFTKCSNIPSWEEFLVYLGINPALSESKVLRIDTIGGGLNNFGHLYTYTKFIYRQLLYNACFKNEEMEKILNAGDCKFSHSTTDAFFFTVNNDDFESIKKEWGNQKVREFNGVKLHSKCLELYKQNFLLPDGKTSEIAYTISNGKYDVIAISSPYWAQYYKLITNQPIIEYDTMYHPGEKTGLVKML